MSNMCGLFLKPLGKNYYIRDFIAYTEDDISIQKLRILSVPPKLEEDTLRAYFIINFGSVVYLHIFQDSKRSEPCLTGEVLFADPMDAASALERPVHCLDGMEFMVEPSYSWRQPSAYGSPGQQQTPQELASILKLNNDCWLYILKFLSIRDLLRFARTCQRFRAVYQLATARRYTSLNTRQFFKTNVWDMGDVCQQCGGDIQDVYKMTLWDIRDFYQLSGHQIKDLECKLPMRDSDERFGFISSCCRNLTSLYLGRKVLTNDTMLKMPTTIEKLDLGKCYQVQDIPTVCKHFSQLRKLNLAEIKLTDKMCQSLVYGNCCPKLEMLRLSPFEDGKCELLAQLPSLKSVIIYSRNGTNTSGVELTDELVEHKAMLLERLEFDCANHLPFDQLCQIAKLIGLRTLILPIWFGVKEYVLQEFSHLKKLEQICFNYKGESDDGIIELFTACPKLSHLSIIGYYKSTKELVLGIAGQVRQEQATKQLQRKIPIEMGLPYDITNPGVFM